MRTPDDPESQIEEPELDSPLPGAHSGAALLALGIVLLVFAVGALPLLRPDLRSGHHFYVWVVAALLAVALLCIVAGWALRRRQRAGPTPGTGGRMA